MPPGSESGRRMPRGRLIGLKDRTGSPRMGFEDAGNRDSETPETGSNDQSGPEDIARGEPRESTSIPPLLQVVHPPDQLESRLGNAKLALPGHKRPLPPDRILLNPYLPPRGPSSAIEEVTAPGPDDIKLILHRWKPFNPGKFAADRLDDLYPRTLRMPVTA